MYDELENYSNTEQWKHITTVYEGIVHADVSDASYVFTNDKNFC